MSIRMNICAVALILLALSSNAQNSAFGPGSRPAPAIAEVQYQALRYARLEASEISSWKRRVRLSALLPRLQVDYSRRVKNDVDIDINDSVYVGSNGVVVGPEEGSYSLNNNADQNVGVKAVWSFNEAIFNPDMLDVSAEARSLARERQAILAEVNRNYYERERIGGEISALELDLDLGKGDAKIRHEIFMKKIAEKEAVAALDALTGGWFSRQLEEGVP